MEWSHASSASRKMMSLALLLALAFLLPGCATQLETYRKEGVRQYNAQQYDQSLATLKKALQQDQFDAVSNAYAGLIEYRQDNLQQAEYHFRVALQSDPSSEEAKAGLTATLIKEGKPDQALDALERAAALAEKVDDPRWLKTDIKKPYTKQVEERLFLGKVNDRIRIARTYERLGDYDNAMLYYKKALDLSPSNANVLMSMANLAEKAGNKAQTRDLLRQTYLADPATPGLTDAMTRNGLAISEVLDNKK